MKYVGNNLQQTGQIIDIMIILSQGHNCNNMFLLYSTIAVEPGLGKYKI